MRVLLDTHALLWWWTDDPRLSAAARTVLVDRQHEVHVSAASAWEIATKARLGKLGIPQACERFAELVALDGFIHLPIQVAHSLRAGAYPQAHRDPFDRMLAAQAELDDLKLVTSDPALAAFPAERLW
ncbi:MAG: type II toxin-antitoxin system VapC family toxin [Rubrivivax sp.]